MTAANPRESEIATSNVHTLSVATCTLDAHCKATLTIMLRNGWVKAQTPYMTTQQVLSLGELGHLLQHGGLIMQAGAPIPTLRSYTAPKFGPGAGIDVGFTLNVDLA